METHVEDKKVIAENRTGDESGMREVDRSQEPQEGMVFETDEAIKTHYDEYARRVGFCTRIVSSRRSERDGSIISRRLACNKEGFNINRQKSGRLLVRKRESIREGCKAMILAKREKPGRWVIKKFVKDHNHPLVISADNPRPLLDDKDRRIRELTIELNRANEKLAECQKQLRAVLGHADEHIGSLSKAVKDAVQDMEKIESEDIYSSESENM